MSQNLNRKKGIINNSVTDPNKILPMSYMWARQHYKDGIANNWTPEEISMQQDTEQWKAKDFLTEDERRLILWNLGFFATAESLTANNLVLAVYKHVTNPECRQYLLRQAFEEAIHTDTFIYCCDTLGLDPEEIYTMYTTIPSIKEKDDFVIRLTESIFDPYFTTDTAASLRAIEIKADVVLKGTRVDGIYTADPEKDPNAVRYEEISFQEVYDKDLNVMDMTAITLCKENKLPIIVFDMNKPGNFMKIAQGEPIGTLVH